jgi:antitoxin HigA-1
VNVVWSDGRFDRSPTTSIETLPRNQPSRPVHLWCSHGDEAETREACRGENKLREDAKVLTAIHPGEHLAEELEALNMSAAELARQLKVPTNRITGIVNGQRSVTGDTALRLAHFFGTTSEFWLNLQSLYDRRIAEQKSGESIRNLPTLERREPIHT